MKELVSIIIPAYQEEKRIERCLQSIFASTYQNLELIVVNDGSTDGTERIVRSFKEENESKNILIELINIPNGGTAKARNLGLHFAHGDYIGFVDADDMIKPYMIEKLVKSLRRGNDLATCGLLYCDEKGRAGFHQYHLCGQKKKCPQEALKMAMWEQIQMSMCSALFRREIIMSTNGKPEVLCPEDVIAFEDFAFICEYISRCNRTMEVLPFRGYLYCKHSGSSTTNIYTAGEICHALQPVLTVGNKQEDEQFIEHKLQYVFRFMAFWYEKAARSNKHDFFPGCENWAICMRELERYVEVYMKAHNVALYKKIAMWIVWRHPGAGWIMAKTIGKIIINGV